MRDEIGLVELLTLCGYLQQGDGDGHEALRLALETYVNEMSRG